MIAILCVLVLLMLVGVGWWMLARNELTLEPDDLLTLLMLLSLLDDAERS